MKIRENIAYYAALAISATVLCAIASQQSVCMSLLERQFLSHGVPPQSWRCQFFASSSLP